MTKFYVGTVTIPSKSGDVFRGFHFTSEAKRDEFLLKAAQAGFEEEHRGVVRTWTPSEALSAAITERDTNSEEAIAETFIAHRMIE